MILIDYTQVALGSLMVSLNRGEELSKNLARHITLNSLRHYRSKFTEDYGELVVCCDSRKYWRREYFPNYKANRKKDREKSEYDWNFIFEILNDIEDELKEFFPYKVIEVEGAEADDIIATLSNCGEEQIMIVSSDKDFIQLHSFLVEQYSPLTKKLVNNNDPKQYLKEHIIKGDRSDGIPNVLSADDTFISEKRQKPIRKTLIAELTEQMGKYEPEDLYNLAKCPKDTWVRNWHRNETLIDLNKIPTTICQNILKEFDTIEVGRRDKLFNYFIENKLTNLLDNIGDY